MNIIDRIATAFDKGQTIFRAPTVRELLLYALDQRDQLEAVRGTLQDSLKSEEALREQLETTQAALLGARE